VGPLPETNWYDDYAAHGGEVETEPVFEAADAMRDELIAVIERQAKMLRLAAHEYYAKCDEVHALKHPNDLTAMPLDELEDIWLEGLARRAEEEADHD
jgi:hypothetical protein